MIYVPLIHLTKPPYDPLKDFAPIARTVAGPLVLTVNPSLPVKNVRDLIDGVYSEKAGREAERLEQDALQRARVEDMSEKDIGREIKRLEKTMLAFARDLEFEKAARVRDELSLLKKRAFGAPGGDPVVA